MTFDRISSYLRLHTLAILCWAVSFFFWKDYLTHPHHPVTRAELVPFTATYRQSGRLVSLPSGSGAGSYLILEESKRSLDLSFVSDLRDFQTHTPENAQVTITHSPEVDLTAAGQSAQVFSLVSQGKEYVDTDGVIRSYNQTIATRQRNAALTTALGFVLFGVVWLVHKKLTQRR